MIPKKLVMGGPVSQNWRVVNALIDQQNSVETRVSNLKAAVAELRSSKRFGGGGGSGIFAAKLQADKGATDNYVSVKLATYNESTNVWDVSGDAFNVAMPPRLTTTYKPATECEIAPAYSSGTIIWIAAPTGGTGVEVSGADLEYIDCNLDARHWCFLFPYCEGATTREFWIPIGYEEP